jgi:hypothetical protein
VLNVDDPRTDLAHRVHQRRQIAEILAFDQLYVGGVGGQLTAIEFKGMRSI